MYQNFFKTLPSFLIILVLFSCSNQPECDSSESESLLKQLIKDEFYSEETKLAFQLSGHNVDLSKVDEFIENIIVVENIRKTSINKDLKMCECNASINLKFSDDFLKTYENIQNENPVGVIMWNKLFKEDLNFDYSLQFNTENELYLETNIDFKELFIKYFGFMTILQRIDSSKDKNEEDIIKENQQTVKIDSKKTINFLKKNIGKEICYEEIESEKDNSGSIRISLTYKENNAINGEFGWYVDSESGSWDGFFQGNINDDVIYAKFKYYEEGTYYEDDIEIRLDEKNLVIKYFEDRITNMKIDKNCSFPYRSRK